LCLIVAVGTALRVFKLNTDLWLDEIATLVGYMRRPLHEILVTFEGANQHLLNSVLGHLSVSAFGEAAWSVRLPAVLFGAGGVWALYYFARCLTTEREALSASALLAASYHHVWFSQNARGYTGMIFFTLVASGFLIRALALNRRRYWIGYSLTMSVGVLTLLNSAFFFASHIPAYVSTFPRWRDWPTAHRRLTIRLLAATALAALLTLAVYSPMLPSMIDYFGDGATGSEMGWTSPIEFLAVVVRGLASGLGPAGLAAILLGGGLALTGLASFWRQSSLVVVLLTLPVLLNLLALVVLKFGAYPRSFLYVLPLGLLLTVRGAVVGSEWLVSGLHFERDRRERVAQVAASAVVGLMLLVSVASVTFNYRYPKQDYSAALEHAVAGSGPEDSICAVGWAASSYRVYYAPNLCFPDSLGELRTLEEPRGRVWVIYSFTRDMRRFWPDMFDYIQESYDLEAEFPGTLGDGTLFVARSRTPSDDS
jgi:uncharacterized membrane protein